MCGSEGTGAGADAGRPDRDNPGTAEWGLRTADELQAHQFEVRGSSGPRLIRRRAIDRRDLAADHSQVHRELAAMMDLVADHEERELDGLILAGRFRRDEEGHRLQLGL